MPRKLLYLIGLAAFCLPARADERAPAAETVIRLTVHPMAAPKPALRYLLLPELKEMNPGNPIQGYLRCFAEQQNFFFNKEACERRDKLLTLPLNELPTQELQDYGKFALRQADWAARLDNPDWQVLLKLKTEGIGLLLADVQQMRSLAFALKVRFRAEVALGRFDDALGTAKTMFALSHHLSEHPTLVAGVIGIVIASVAIEPLQEMLEQPGCPNLYWALTYLPDHLVSLDKGAEGERLWIQPEFRDLDDRAPMSADQLQRFIAHFDKLLSEKGKPQESKVRAWLDARNQDAAVVSAARHRLVESGLPEERLLQFPADQVILLDEKRECFARQDDAIKMVHLPAWQFEALAAQMRLHERLGLFDVAQTTAMTRRALGRLDQRIALLRHVEALRLFAAEHDGTLPAKLSDISVPLPDDPFTGRPFRYEVTGGTAHLRGSPPPGAEKEPGFNIHYEVTFQK
jgi:hypothetical protein